MKMLRQILGLVLIGFMPAVGSAELIAELDFTGGGSDWSISVTDSGYPCTFELDGDVTKAGYAQNTAATASIVLMQEVFAPAGTTSN